MLNVVGNKKIYFTFSALAVGAAVAAISLYGFREGIDFRGGTLWQFSIRDNTPSIASLEAKLRDTLSQDDVRVNLDSTGAFLARFPEVPEETHQQYLAALKGSYPSFEEMSFASIGPSVGAELRRKSVIAIILVLVGISFYIAYAFRKASYPVSSWKYGWVTLLTLFHDVAIPAGLLAFLGSRYGVEIDGNFVVALLVVMGFSVHDTIVVFDRIRENVVLRGRKERFETVVNESVNQTLARSVNTSLTLILVLLALYFAGPEALHYFILTLLVGVTTGIYSSIFIASPLLIFFKGKQG
ncbi:MAG: protein translocase subunit SecF [Candidatus Liptonbacteria bacterium]|nr:protein translocase subunit SecF [Candidatus Liptonbacteria bacterium]